LRLNGTLIFLVDVVMLEISQLYFVVGAETESI
jgi:hypothetical protein